MPVLPAVTRWVAEQAASHEDRAFDEPIAQAESTLDLHLRLRKIAEREQHVVESMPALPIVHNIFSYPQKPFVHGFKSNALDRHSLNYAWIDTNRRPAA